MANLATLPTLTMLALAGIGSGLYLGKSAIGEINPAHFASPYAGSRFHADLVPNRSNGAPASLQQAGLATDYGSGCLGCRTYPEEYFPRHDPAVDDSIYASAGETPPDEIVAEVDREIAFASSRAERASVERYMHYSVSADEAPVTLASAADEGAEGAVEPTPGT